MVKVEKSEHTIIGEDLEMYDSYALLREVPIMTSPGKTLTVSLYFRYFIQKYSPKVLP